MRLNKNHVIGTQCYFSKGFSFQNTFLTMMTIEISHAERCSLMFQRDIFMPIHCSKCFTLKHHSNDDIR